MSLRTAFEQSRWITLAIAGAFLWVMFTAVRVWTSMSGTEAGGAVGQTVETGIVGMVVLLATLALLLTVGGEFGSEEPSPEAWPPEE